MADGRRYSSKLRTIPDENTWNLAQGAAMLYYCDNETVESVAFAGFPETRLLSRARNLSEGLRLYLSRYRHLHVATGDFYKIVRLGWLPQGFQGPLENRHSGESP